MEEIEDTVKGETFEDFCRKCLLLPFDSSGYGQLFIDTVATALIRFPPHLNPCLLGLMKQFFYTLLRTGLHQLCWILVNI